MDATIGLTWLITLEGGGIDRASILHPVQGRFFTFFCLYTNLIIIWKTFIFLFFPFFDSISRKTVLRQKKYWRGFCSSLHLQVTPVLLYIRLATMWLKIINPLPLLAIELWFVIFMPLSYPFQVPSLVILFPSYFYK